MTSLVVRNAQQRLKQLKEEVKALRKQVADRERELKEIDLFLQQHAKFSAKPEMTVDDVGLPEHHINPSKESVARDVQAILMANGKPMKRDALYKRLDANNVDIRGKNPQMILSTMLWRMPEKFVRLAGHGYWLKNLPFEPAGYEPDSSSDDSK